MVCLNLDIYAQSHKIRSSDEGRDFDRTPFIILATNVLDCQHGKDRKASAKVKAKETKSEKKVNLSFVKWNQ